MMQDERKVSRLESSRKTAFDARRADWRLGPVVYQVIVDRFAPSLRLEAKSNHYSPPYILRDWDKDLPRRGRFLDEVGVCEGELEFWGGDLDSVRSRLDYIESLGVGCLYLNPIFRAFTNHKYDTCDYREIDPQYGSADDLRALADEAHGRGMKLILDGVFNHMGRRAPLFERALANPGGPEAGFFTIGEHLKRGFLSWRNTRNLPELNLENSAVRAMIYDAPGSVVRRTIREQGIDGWRLDVAPDLGLAYLEELAAAAYAEKSEAVVIGECWNYPEQWLEVIDGVLNMHLREMLLGLVDGRVSAGKFNRSLDRMIGESRFEGLLKSHLVLDNHDTPRLAEIVGGNCARSFLRGLQFTLPGSPVIYYGSEVGMRGGRDPGCRAPMRWDLVADKNDDLADTRRLSTLRRENPALAIGDCRVLEAERLVAFLRSTDRAVETVLVLANPEQSPVTELVPVRHSLLMDAAPLECVLSGEEIVMHSGTVEVTVPGRTIRIFRTADRGDRADYSAFKRVY